MVIDSECPLLGRVVHHGLVLYFTDIYPAGFPSMSVQLYYRNECLHTYRWVRSLDICVDSEPNGHSRESLHKWQTLYYNNQKALFNSICLNRHSVDSEFNLF